MSAIETLFVFGTRPEAIKLAPLVRRLRDDPRFGVRVCVTGQHRQMLDQVLGLFEITPDVDLALMRPDQSLADITAAALTEVGRVIAETSPDVVLVQGDTTTAFAAALAAFYQRRPVGHVEAGLRTGDIYAPFPEEVNRRLIGRVASLHFAPTARSRDNLLAEGVAAETIAVTGNTGIDALLLMRERLASDRALRARVAEELHAGLSVDLAAGPFVLVTGHRRENFGAGFEDICRALRRLALAHPDLRFVYPVHFNPRVRGPVLEHLGALDNVHLIAPTDYAGMLWLLEHCRFVLTDSGGLQEEAPGLGKPVLVMRETTERPEAVEAGTARLVGTDADLIVAESERLLSDETAYRAMSRAHNPFGDGHASGRIAERLDAHFAAGERDATRAVR